MLGKEGQEGAADQCEIGQKIGIGAAGPIFSEDDVAPPMISDLNTRPMPANERQPLGRTVMLGRCAGQVVVRFGGGLIGFLDASSIAQHNQTSGKGEVRLQGFYGEGVQGTGFDPSVSGFGDGKKGVPWSASRRCACLKRRFWLPLIWSR